MVEATAFGRIKLLRVTADLDQRSWGWPLWLVGIAGVGLALKDRATRQVAISLLLFVVAYYVGFINVVRYAFDRYVLPICVVEALFVGFAFDRWLARSSRVTVRAAVGAAFAGVDILYGPDARPMVLEVNSMPAWAGAQKVVSADIAALLADDLVAALARRKRQETVQETRQETA